MFLRHPEGWGGIPPFLLCFIFPLLHPQPHCWPTSPRARGRKGRPRSRIHSSRVCGMPQAATHGSHPQGRPQSSWGTSFPPEQLQGKLRQSCGPRRGKASTTPSPALLFGFGRGEAKGWHAQKAQHSRNIQSTQQARLEARHTEPALPRSPPPTAHQRAPAWRGGVGQPESTPEVIEGAQAISDCSLGLQSPAQPHPNPQQPTKAPVRIEGHLLREAPRDSSSLWRPHLLQGCPVFPRVPTPAYYCIPPRPTASHCIHLYTHLQAPAGAP